MTNVLGCSCDNKYQDRIYGINRRVHNKMEKKAGTSDIWKCTCCGLEKILLHTGGKKR